MRARVRGLLFLFTLLVLLATGAGGCGGAFESAKSAAPEMASAVAPSAEMADNGPAGSKAGEGEAKTWKRSGLTAHTVRVEVGEHEELPVRSMQARVAVEGFQARVVLDFVVRNDMDRTFEGTLKLRLPEGASPYFFAFGENVVAMAGDAQPAFFPAEQARSMGTDPAEIMRARAAAWQGPREARMVPREKASFAYGATVRRAVDPALLEWSGPSIFSARVFPLTAGKSHRIVVGYDVPLTRIGGDLVYTFDLPANVRSKAIDMSVAAPSGTAVDIAPTAQAVPVAERRHYRFDDPTGTEITVRLKKPGQAFLLAKDPATGPYFATDITPSLPPAAAAPGADTALFLVDTSLSSNPDRFNIWLKLLQSILEKNRDTLKRYNVLFFDVEQSFFKPGFVNNDEASMRDLLAYANTLSLEGATDLGAALRRAASPPGGQGQDAPARWDVFLLSDGAATWGESDAFTMTRLLAQSPVSAIYGYQTGLSGTDNEALSILTRETGGAVFSVMGDAEVEKAATAHRARPFRLLEARIDGASDVLLAGRPRFLYPGQTLRVVGRGTPGKGATLELALETGGKQQVVRAPLGQAMSSDLAVRAYGQVAVAQLEELSPLTEGIARAYATHFRVPGRTCSLLMLESEADYQRFGIRPEDDASAIQAQPASAAVNDALTQAAATLGNPKLAFLRWLDGLPAASGVTLSLPPALRPTLAQMPEAAFRVEAAPLSVKSRDRASIPQSVLAALASHKLDYDMIVTEAERRRASLGNADALRGLSSLVEENTGDAVLAHDVGITAMSWGLAADAYHLFRRVAAARPYEPQTYRAMAQALARLGQTDLAMAYFEVGLAGAWDPRFGEFKKILAVEYLELLRRIENGLAKTSAPAFAKERLAAIAPMVQLGRADLVVMITWNTDATDVDLHVVEPSGEECFYAHRDTASGGRITQDVTQGYGPEMYVLQSAPQGRYAIRAHYYASDRNRASTRTKVQVLVIEDFGSPRQRTTEKVVTLEYNKESHDLMTVVRGAKAQIAGP
jgi:hypothetical protein